MRYSLAKTLTSEAVTVESCETARAAIERVRAGGVDLVLLDVRLPDLSGIEALTAMRASEPRLTVVVITAHGTTETAIEATKRGAFDYLLKPFDLPTLRTVVQRALEANHLSHRSVATEATTSDSDSPTEDRLVGRSAAMQEVFKAIGRVAESDVNVLLLGESGAGKELVARAIFQHSRRANSPFLAINCAAIPEALLESELFGHERGAYTGAERQRVGRFEQADGGTVFLDEIGDMSPSIQAKVLRLLQDQRFERVGGNETIQTDVRVIAATNQNLPELVAAGRFRQDLFYRLNTYTIALPPLRGRRDDVQQLAEYFLRRHAAEVGRCVTGVTPEAVRLLEAYDWPGNVRELQGAVKTALVNATSDVLTPDCLPEAIRNVGHRAAPAADGSLDVAQLARQLITRGEGHVYRKVVMAVDRVVLDEALRVTEGNQVEASALLGISRTTLRAKLGLLRSPSRLDANSADRA